MDLQKLTYFHCVAEHLSFSIAAEKCHIAQTAMSRSIASLEDELGFKLFDRSYHKVTLTPAGQYFFAESTEILQKFQSAQERALGISHDDRLPLRIGFGAYERQLMMEHVQSFRKVYPNTLISVCQLPSSQLLPQLLTSECGVVYGPRIRFDNVKNGRMLRLYTSQFSLAVSRDNPLSAISPVPPAMLNGQTFVCPVERDKMLMDSFRCRCGALGFSPGEILCSNTPESMYTMGELNLAMALVPDFLNFDASRRIRILPIDCPPVYAKEHIVIGLNNTGDQMVQRFLDHVEELLAQKAEEK